MWQIEVYMTGNEKAYHVDETSDGQRIFLSEDEADSTTYTTEQLGDVVNAVIAAFPNISEVLICRLLPGGECWNNAEENNG